MFNLDIAQHITANSRPGRFLLQALNRVQCQQSWQSREPVSCPRHRRSLHHSIVCVSTGLYRSLLSLAVSSLLPARCLCAAVMRRYLLITSTAPGAMVLA